MSPTICKEDVSSLTAGGAHLVEVLPVQEYEQEQLSGAISIPLKKLNRQTAV